MGGAATLPCCASAPDAPPAVDSGPEGTWRAHLARSHRWGIVHGLEVTILAGGIARVGRGIAIAGDGAELVLGSAILIGEADLQPLVPTGPGAKVPVDLWILEDRPAGARGKQEPPLIRATPMTPSLDAARPPGTSPGAPPASNLPPATGGPEWPVFLGRVQLRSDGDLEDDPDTPDRHYAGVTAARVADPRGATAIDLTPHPPGPAGAALPGGTVALTAPAAGRTAGGEVLRLMTGGLVARRGVRVERAVILGDRSPKPTAGALDLQPVPTPGAPMPWRIYRTSAEDEQKRARGQLRLELPDPGKDGDPRLLRLDVGSQASPFTPRLSVAADRTVTIPGDLEAIGSMVIVPPETAPGAEAADPVSPEWLAGIEIASTGGLHLTIAFGSSSFSSGGTLSFTLTARNSSGGQLTAVTVSHLVSFGLNARPVGTVGFGDLADGAAPTSPQIGGFPIPAAFTGFALVSATATASGGGASVWVTRAVPVTALN